MIKHFENYRVPLMMAFCVVFTGCLAAADPGVSISNVKSDTEDYVCVAPDKSVSQVKLKTIKNKKILRSEKRICGYLTSRSDGRYKSTLGFTHDYLKRHKPRLAFDPDFTQEEFGEWKTKVRSKLLNLMRFPELTDKLEPKLLSTHQRQGYTLQKWEAYPEPGSVVPFLMLVPDGVDETNPAPVVHCYSGSASTKELLCREPEVYEDIPPRRHYDKNNMALEYVRAGLIAIAVEHPGVGELAERSGSLTYSSMHAGRMKLSQDLIMMGRSYLGLSAFQKWTILQWSKTLSFVDSRKIAISAHSLGVEPLVVVGVLDDDICAIVCNDFVGDSREREIALAATDDGVHIRPMWGLWHCVPDFWVWFTQLDLQAALAPVPLLLTEGGQATSIEKLKKAYRLVKAEKDIKVHYYPKFADKINRPFDFKELPEGITNAEYFLRCNVDPANHYFKAQIAVPWLLRYVQE